MKRSELEHLIRAAASIADDDEIVIIGSQSILGSYPDAPPPLLVSMEADLFPRHHPERADLIDGSIGEGSFFHTTFGYYAQGVGPETAVLPANWEVRLIAVRNEGTRGATGWTLEVNDLLISKYVAGREKDFVFCEAAVAAGLCDEETLLARLAATALDDRLREIVKGRIRADFARPGRGRRD